MKRLKIIADNCKAEVMLMINEHKGSYESIKDHLDRDDIKSEIAPEVYKKIIELDTMIDLFMYTDTPVGSFHLIHYDLDKILDAGIELLKEYRGTDFINLFEE